MKQPRSGHTLQNHHSVYITPLRSGTWPHIPGYYNINLKIARTGIPRISGSLKLLDRGTLSHEPAVAFSSSDDVILSVVVPCVLETVESPGLNFVPYEQRFLSIPWFSMIVGFERLYPWAPIVHCLYSGLLQTFQHRQKPLLSWSTWGFLSHNIITWGQWSLFPCLYWSSTALHPHCCSLGTHLFNENVFDWLACKIIIIKEKEKHMKTFILMYFHTPDLLFLVSVSYSGCYS